MATERELPKRKRPKDRRDVILRTAAGLFSQHGFHAVGIDDIGGAVGITGPAVYRHFSTKEDIVMAAIDRNLERMLLAVTSIAASSGEDQSTTGVRPMVSAVVASELDDWDFAVVWRREARGLPRERLDEIQPRRREIIRLIGQAARAANDDLIGDGLRLRLEAQHGVLTGVLLLGARAERRRYLPLVSNMAADVLEMRGIPEPQPPTVGHRAPAAVDRSSRRETLVSAAVHLFVARGYPNVGVDDAGAHAGITGPSVYRHFESKDALLCEPLRRMGNVLLSGLVQLELLDVTATDRLGLWVQHLAEVAQRSPDLFVLFFTQGHYAGGDVPHAPTLAALTAEWEGLLRRARPQLAPFEARTTVMGTVGAALGVTAAQHLRPLDRRPALHPILERLQLGTGERVLA